MTWFVYAFLCALLVSVATLLGKRTLLHEHAMEYASTLAFLSMVMTMPLFFFIDYSQVTLAPVLILFGVAMLASTAFFVVIKAMRHLEVSLLSPLLVMKAGATALLGWVLLSESLTPVQVLGVVLLVIGAYVLELRYGQGFLRGMKDFFTSQYIMYAVLAIFLYSICAVGDRFVLTQYDIPIQAYVAFAHVFMALQLFILLTVFHDGYRGIMHGIRYAGVSIFIIALLTVGYRTLYLISVNLAYIGLVSSIKQLSALFTTLIGGELFHEQSLVRRSIACLILICGSILIVL